jgi:hypothetical protein
VISTLLPILDAISLELNAPCRKDIKDEPSRIAMRSTVAIDAFRSIAKSVKIAAKATARQGSSQL